MSKAHTVHNMTKVADTGAAVAAGGAAITWFVEVQQWIDITAGIVAILAGLFTIAWHIKKFKDEHKNR